MSKLAHAWFCAGLECLCAAQSVALWLWTGHTAFLFLGGLAVGCALVIAALAFEQHRIDAVSRRLRTDA